MTEQFPFNFFVLSELKMIEIVFNRELQETDPHSHPVLIIGQVRHLSCLAFSDINKKLGQRVSPEIFENSLSSLHPSPTDVCPLYLGLATVAALPLKCSRYNSTSRSHAITKLVKSHKNGVNETIVVSRVLNAPHSRSTDRTPFKTLASACKISPGHLSSTKGSVRLILWKEIFLYCLICFEPIALLHPRSPP